MGELRLDAQAWLTSFSFPASLLFGGGKGDGKSNSGVKSESGPGNLIPDWYRTKPGWKYHVHDLGPIKGEQYDPRTRAVNANAYRETIGALATNWSGKSGARGTGSGLTGKPSAGLRKLAADHGVAI